MTDEEIIKALECCAKYRWVACVDCSQVRLKTCKGVNPDIILDLINRQKVEIEKLQKLQQVQADRIIEERGRRYELASTVSILNKQIKTAKSEAIREFAMRFIEIYSNCSLSSSVSIDMVVCDIKRLIKEMTECENG